MKIGDRVRFVDDVGDGVIKGFSKDKTIALVENELGITMNVPLNKCVLLHQKEDYGKIKNKQQNNPTSPNQKRNSRAGANILEVDLHIEKLLHEKSRMNAVLRSVSNYLTDRGISNLPMPLHRDDVDETLHRKAAALRAGLGWLGKNDRVVHRLYGSQTVTARIYLGEEFPVNTHIR
ncbi:MAG: hypothetical protein J6T30_06970, partial [Bacteroidales bacterium]|nr:hypothetical protein [Bacteroidales bacterium]